METQSKIVKKVVSLLKKQCLNYEITDYLKSEGILPADYNKIVDEATVIYEKYVFIKRRIIWSFLTVFTFILFFFLIPVSIQNMMPYLISFVGAGLFTFFLVQAIADFRSFEEFNTKDPNKQNWRQKYTPFLVIPGIIMVFVFVLHYSSRESSELKKYGIQTEGTIIDGSSLESRRGGTYSVTVKFSTKEGNEIIVKEDVGKSEFSQFYKGEIIQLIYSSRDPKIIEILSNKDQVKNFTGIKERNVEIKDLLQLIDSGKTGTEQFLKTIGIGWIYRDNDSIWLNNRSDEALKIFPKKGIRYITRGLSTEIPKQLKILGFKSNADQADSLNLTNKLYFNGHYTVSIERNLKDNILTIVSIVKIK
jgi:hypothetical protein